MPDSLDPLLVDSYDYTLPKELIASTPADPKDSARLLVYEQDSGKITHSGIYIGRGRFIHSSSGKRRGVVVSNLNSVFYSRAFRWGGRVVE
jgi:cell wall-associated NlpC family hydrolase